MTSAFVRVSAGCRLDAYPVDCHGRGAAASLTSTTVAMESEIEVRVVRDEELSRTGEVTAAGYLADGLLTRADGRFDVDYQQRLLDTRLRARQADVLVAVDRSASAP